MYFAQYSGEKLADLVAKFYDLHDARSAALTKDAENALNGANPNLKTAAKGSTIVVPDVPGLSVTGEARSLPSLAAKRVNAARTALSALQAELEKSAKSRGEADTRSLQLLASRELAAKARKDKVLRERLDTIKKNVKQSIKASSKKLQERKQTFDQLSTDLDKFAARFARNGNHIAVGSGQ